MMFNIQDGIWDTSPISVRNLVNFILIATLYLYVMKHILYFLLFLQENCYYRYVGYLRTYSILQKEVFIL